MKMLMLLSPWLGCNRDVTVTLISNWAKSERESAGYGRLDLDIWDLGYQREI